MASSSSCGTHSLTLQQLIDQEVGHGRVAGTFSDVRLPDDIEPPALHFLNDLLQRCKEPLDKWDDQPDEVRFLTRDCREVRTRKSFFRKSLLLREFFQQRTVPSNSVLELCTIHSTPLLKVLDWCERHADHFDVDVIYGSVVSGRDADPGYYLEGVSDNDREYVEGLGDEATLADVLLAADFFRFDGLTRLLSRAMADKLKGATAEQIRAALRLPNDLRPADEDDIRLMNEWTIPSKQHFDITF